MNNCIFIGRLTKDVEVKQAGETTIANFTVAVNRRFKKEGQPSADFLPMVAFGKTAENIAKFFSKGSEIGILSRVQTRSWEADDGTRRYITEFVVESFDFTGGSRVDKGSVNDDDDDEFELEL